MATLGARLVLIAVADYAQDDGQHACASVESYARKANLSPRAVRQALRRLEDDGQIRYVGDSPYGTREYEILGMDDPPVRGRKELPPPRKMTTPDGRELPPTRSEELDVCSWGTVSAAWLGAVPPLIAHRPAYFEQPEFVTVAKKALKVYPAAEVAEAIRNYAVCLGSPEYRWSYSWTAVDFLRRGLDRFVSAARPLENFRERGGGRGGQEFADLDEVG